MARSSRKRTWILKVIKVWYQNGNGWYSYFGDTELKLTPELLLNDEDLIQVDTRQVQNYARLTGKDGKVSYHWITPPLEIEFGSNGASELFSPMKEDFRDAPTLQPVTLNEGEFRQFFLTAHVTGKHAPGLYRGEIRMLRDSESLGAIPVALRVLPFKLPSPKAYFDLNKDLLVANMSYIGLDLISLQNGGDLKLAERQLRSIVKNMRDHGQSIHPLREDNGLMVPLAGQLCLTIPSPPKPSTPRPDHPCCSKHRVPPAT